MPWRYCLRRHSERDEHHARQKRKKGRKRGSENQCSTLITTQKERNKKMSPPPTGPPLPLHKSFAASAIAACSAEFLTLPLDTAKVRLQIQPTTSSSQAMAAAGGASTSSMTTAAPTKAAAAPIRPKYSGLIGTIRTVAAEEGAASLWKGLVPSMHRQVLYGGERNELR